MQNITSFHGTSKDIANNSIRFSPANIKITTYKKELQKGANHRQNRRAPKPKPPGSLGYGFYTFVNSDKLAREFIARQAADYELIKVLSEFDETQILNFSNEDIMDKFHAYRSQYLKHVENMLKVFGNPMNSHKQHTVDGLIIENFIEDIFKNEKKEIKAVMAWTFTPCDELSEDGKFVSFIPNGLELCIRDCSLINSLEKGDV